MAGFGALLTGVGLVLSAIEATRRSRSKTYRTIKNLPNSFSNPQTKSLDEPTASLHKVKTLEERVALLVPLIQKGRRDPIVRQRIMKYFRDYDVPERDTGGELAAIRAGLSRDSGVKTRAIYAGVRKDVRYRRDIYGIDTFQSPRRTLEFGGGDCDDYTSLLASMYLSAGFPVRIKIIETKVAAQGRTSPKEPNWDHIFVLVGVPPENPESGRWIPVDGSLQREVGWEAPRSIVNTSITFAVDQ